VSRGKIASVLTDEGNVLQREVKSEGWRNNGVIKHCLRSSDSTACLYIGVVFHSPSHSPWEKWERSSNARITCLLFFCSLSRSLFSSVRNQYSANGTVIVRMACFNMVYHCYFWGIMGYERLSIALFWFQRWHLESVPPPLKSYLKSWSHSTAKCMNSSHPFEPLGLVGGVRADIVMLWFIAAIKILIIFSHAGFFQCGCLAAMLTWSFDSVVSETPMGLLNINKVSWTYKMLWSDIMKL